MKIVRHVAPDMRQALRSIRAQLGEDAVILSSRRIPEGVEVTAAVDFDANALQDAMSNPAAVASDLVLGQSARYRHQHRYRLQYGGYGYGGYYRPYYHRPYACTPWPLCWG